MKNKIDKIDKQIINLTKERTQLMRQAQGQVNEMDTLVNYREELGRDGVSMGLILMRLARGGIK